MFYGWYIVAAGVLLIANVDFGLIYGFTAFVTPITTTFGWSHTQISLAMSLRGIESGTVNPFLGMLIDRWPARRAVLIGVIIYGLGLLCISQASNLVIFYIGFFNYRAGQFSRRIYGLTGHCSKMVQEKSG
ncbi:MFS transporter [Chloroflexota bacterium]